MALALYLGIGPLSEWIVGRVGLNLSAGLMGSVILLVTWVPLVYIAAHRDRWHPGTSRIRTLFALVVWVLLGLVGAGMLAYAFVSSGASGF